MFRVTGLQGPATSGLAAASRRAASLSARATARLDAPMAASGRSGPRGPPAAKVRLATDHAATGLTARGHPEIGHAVSGQVASARLAARIAPTTSPGRAGQRAVVPTGRVRSGAASGPSASGRAMIVPVVSGQDAMDPDMTGRKASVRVVIVLMEIARSATVPAVTGRKANGPSGPGPRASVSVRRTTGRARTGRVRIAAASAPIARGPLEIVRQGIVPVQTAPGARASARALGEIGQGQLQTGPLRIGHVRRAVSVRSAGQIPQIVALKPTVSSVRASTSRASNGPTARRSMRRARTDSTGSPRSWPARASPRGAMRRR